MRGEVAVQHVPQPVDDAVVVVEPSVVLCVFSENQTEKRTVVLYVRQL